jgi:hypothetical protein
MSCDARLLSRMLVRWRKFMRAPRIHRNNKDSSDEDND